MTVPLTGWIAISLFFIGLLKGHRMFFYYALFFMPFSAVGVLNFPNSESTVSYPLFFWVAYLVSFLVLKMKLLDVLTLKSGVLGYILVLYLILSLLFTQNLTLESPFINKFSFSQLFYVFLGVLISISIAIEIRNARTVHIIFKPILLSIFIACLIGLYQKLAFNFGFFYPAEVFNNSLSVGAQGYTAILDGGVKRISSVSTEPSIFAQWLSVSLALLLFRFACNKDIKMTWFEVITIFMGVVTLLLSTSATAYIGLLLLITTFVFLVAGKKNWIYFSIFVVCSLFLFIVLNLSTISLILFDKIDSYSFIERFESVKFGFSVFQENILFGTVWGTVTVHSLIVGLLANAGMIGFTLFFIWLGSEFFKSIKLRGTKKQNLFGQSILLSFVLLLFFQLLTGFVYVYSFFWIMLGFLMGDNLLARFIKGCKN